jgi:hypothetical protein
MTLCEKTQGQYQVILIALFLCVMRKWV